MTKQQELLQELEMTPDPIVQEALDFVRYLKSKRTGSIQPVLPVNETILLSESALAKDWLRPEEDAAWDSL